jgi:hypothetical protein
LPKWPDGYIRRVEPTLQKSMLNLEIEWRLLLFNHIVKHHITFRHFRTRPDILEIEQIAIQQV